MSEILAQDEPGEIRAGAERHGVRRAGARREPRRRAGQHHGDPGATCDTAHGSRLTARAPSRVVQRLSPEPPEPAEPPMFHNLSQLASLPRPDPEPRRARAEGAVPRVGARLLLVVRQPAAAAAWSTRSSFGVAQAAARRPRSPYSLFLFCGLLPWTWFSSSVLESSGVLISGGNLIKKVLFPAEVLPIVTVLSNMVHFLLGLPILVAFLIYYRRPLELAEVSGFPWS